MDRAYIDLHLVTDRYLQGQLSISDEMQVDVGSIHLVTDRYLQGQLSASEEAEFEERLTWDQALVEELELAEQIRDGLRASIASGHVATDSSSPGILSRLWSQPQYAAAASFMVAVVLAAIVFVTVPEPGGGSVSTRTDVIPLVAVRGTARTTITVRNDATSVLLIDESEGYASYRVSIAGQGANATVSWTGERIIPTYPQSLAISLPPGFLDAGQYMLTVEGELTNAAGNRLFEHVRDIPFEVEVAP